MAKKYVVTETPYNSMTKKVCIAVCAVLLPPLSVYLHIGHLNTTVVLSIILTLFLLLPGIIHALWFNYARPE